MGRIASSCGEAEASEERVPSRHWGDALGLEEFPSLQLLCSGFIQELNEKFIYKTKNTVAEQLMNINPR